MAFRKKLVFEKGGMDFTEYVSLITFRFMKPEMVLPVQARARSKLARLMGRFRNSEFVNVHLPCEELATKRRLHQICKFPRMSTIAIGALINVGVSQMHDDQAFVNVGVWHGFSFLAGLINNPHKKCVGIDKFCEFGGPREDFIERFNKYKSTNHHFYEMDYIHYFKHYHKEKIGFYLYDGDHSYENQLTSLQIAEPFFAKSCVILIDDANLSATRKATMDFMSKSSNEYQIVADKITSENGHPTFWNGIMVLKKMD